MKREYWVVTDEDSDILSGEVEKLMLDGWMPQGGVCFTATPIGPIFCQAMIREAVNG